jgi:murein DD-endopeptidase MepM/ murein hydrolase activator NlpD
MFRIFPGALLCAVLLLAVSSSAQLPAASTPSSPVATPGTQAAAPAWQVRTEPATLVNGAPAILYVVPPVNVEGLGGSWMGHKIFFSFDPASHSWYALFGTGLNRTPGKYPLVLEGRTDPGTTDPGTTVSFQQELEVASQPYPQVDLKVQHKFTAPSRRLLRRIRKEEILKHRVFGESSEAQLWRGPFLSPVREPVTEQFGVRRIFNGELKTEHLGLDFHAARGTRVQAANSGRVILARRLFFEGNCVIVDHGEGLMTLYMHLSKFKVRKGQRVRRGQLLGLSGATGRATGPHLHLAVRWEGVYLDPAKLLKLDLPQLVAPHPALAGAREPAERSGAAQSRAVSQN